MECAICLEQYKEPKVLLCKHSYCRECLEKLVKKAGKKHTITCPECRSETEVRNMSRSETEIKNMSRSETEIKKHEW